MKKFNIGDKVDFVNDYGVIFKGFTITDVQIIDGERRYQIEPNDAPWFLKYERNLYLKDTYKKPNYDLLLNNGQVARFCFYSESVEPMKVYAIKQKETLYCVLMEDGQLYGLSILDEPTFPLKQELQPRGASNECIA